MCRGEAIERARNRIRIVTHRLVAADEVWIGVNQHDVAIAQPARVRQVEEDGAAAQKRFHVPVECNRIKAPEVRQELTLPSYPFQERPGAERIHLVKLTREC